MEHEQPQQDRPASQSDAQSIKGSQKSPQNYACVVCAQRKVKCDRQTPCSNCVKGRVECVYRAPPPAKRRKRKLQPEEHETLAKLNRYEKILSNLGVDVDKQLNDENISEIEASRQVFSSERTPRDEKPSALPSRLNPAASDPTSAPPPRGGYHSREYRVSGAPGSYERMFVHGNKSRYTENHLWGSLSDDILRPKDILPTVYDLRAKAGKDSSNLPPPGPGSLIFASGLSAGEVDLRELHPPVTYARRLWEIFRSNVDPLIKLFDIRTKEKMFLANLPKIADGTSGHSPSQFFAFYFCAVTSITNDECMKEFGESRATLLDRYQLATEQSLIAARLLHTSDMFVLQAFFLYLLCMRQRMDIASLWTLNGVALRMAQRAGLHRDADFLDADIWPWHAEMRRRFWWQITMHDGRSTELSGLGMSVWSSFKWDTKKPLNVNDDDLSNEVHDLPPERTGATDMIFCAITYEIGTFFRRMEFSTATTTLPSSTLNVNDQEALINELETNLEQKYLSHCDPLIPLHFLSSIAARSAIATIRFRAYQRCKQQDQSSWSQADKDKIFGLALKIIEYDNLSQSTPSIQKFRFHIQNFFPWHALISILSELRNRTTGSDADRAWAQVAEVFEHRPSIIKEQGTALHMALGNLALRVWGARIKEFERQLPGVPLPTRPAFIESLQALKAAEANESSNVQPAQPVPQPRPYDPVRSDEAWSSEAQNGGPGSSSTWESSTVQGGMTMPTEDYYQGFASNDPSPSNWLGWDDLIFQDFNLAPGFDDTLNFFGPVA